MRVIEVVMMSKSAIFAVLTGFFFLAGGSTCAAVNTKPVETVREKSVLDTQDFQIIDNFVAQAIQELVRTKDLSSVSRIRTIILQNESSNKGSAKAQYAARFFESAYKYMSEAFAEVSQLPTERQEFAITVNLLILLDRLVANGPANLQLADLAIAKLKDENMGVRYWAVHCVANPDFTRRLNSAEADYSKLSSRIVEELKGLVESSSPEIMILMAQFAGDVNAPETEELLLQMANARIKRYADWTVGYELLDTDILKSLHKKISSAGTSKPALARAFAQLYSYAIQRYVKGRDYLFSDEKQQLASVLIETEDKCLRDVLGYRVNIRNALGRDDYEALAAEHADLLGDKTKVGQLAKKWRFDYGQRPDGSKITEPLTLPDPPKSEPSAQ